MIFHYLDKKKNLIIYDPDTGQLEKYPPLNVSVVTDGSKIQFGDYEPDDREETTDDGAKVYKPETAVREKGRDGKKGCKKCGQKGHYAKSCKKPVELVETIET